MANPIHVRDCARKGLFSVKSALFPLAVVAALSSGMALAADPASSDRPRVACKADFAKLCQGVQPGDGRIRECLKQHDAQLSAPCKDAIAKAEARKAAAATAPAQQ